MGASARARLLPGHRLPHGRHTSVLQVSVCGDEERGEGNKALFKPRGNTLSPRATTEWTHTTKNKAANIQGYEKHRNARTCFRVVASTRLPRQRGGGSVASPRPGLGSREEATHIAWTRRRAYRPRGPGRPAAVNGCGRAGLRVTQRALCGGTHTRGASIGRFTTHALPGLRAATAGDRARAAGSPRTPHAIGGRGGNVTQRARVPAARHALTHAAQAGAEGTAVNTGARVTQRVEQL